MTKTGVRLTLIGAVTSILLAVGGCASSVPQSGDVTTARAAQLPTLTEAQQLRDSIARSEFAIQSSASTLKSLATECADCAKSLSAAADASAERLADSGGLWQPWAQEDGQDTKDFPQPDPVGDAPLRPAGLSGYMVETARQQLATLVELPADDTQTNERILLASILAGRLVSATQLAVTFDVAAAAEAAKLPANATLTSLKTAPDSAEGTADPEAENQPQSGTGTAGDENPDQTVSQVITEYDCAATTLSKTSLFTSQPEAERALYDQLLERRIILYQIEGTEALQPRCQLETDSLDELSEAILAADLQLISAHSAEVRKLGAAWLAEDATQLSRWATLSDVTPGTADITKSENSNGEDS